MNVVTCMEEKYFEEKFLLNYANISVISIWICRGKIDNLTKGKPGP